MENKQQNSIKDGNKFNKFIENLNLESRLTEMLFEIRSSIIKHMNMFIPTNFKLLAGYIITNTETFEREDYVFIHHGEENTYIIDKVLSEEDPIEAMEAMENYGATHQSVYTGFSTTGERDFLWFIDNIHIFKKWGINMYPIKIKGNVSNDRKMYIIDVRFNPDFYDIYKVQPEIDDIYNIYDNLQDVYKNNVIAFDHTIVGKSKSFGIHRLVLYINGGETFKHIFGGKFKEMYSTSLEDYSDKTIETFIDYIYGSTDLSSKEFDVVEIYELAEFVQHKNLIINVLNLINYSSTARDKETLIILSERYKNKYLASIIENLE